MLLLKRVHSTLVASIAREIAEGVGMGPWEVDLATAIGLLHDVGRFPQWRAHGTFSDARSVDHGDLSHDTVRDGFPWDGMPANQPVWARAAILDAVKWHNKLSVPEDLAPTSRPYALIVRDADKLDVFRQILEYATAGTLNELYPRVDLDGERSGELLETIERGELASYSQVHSKKDLLLLKVCWLRDLNTEPAMQHAIASGFVDWLASQLPAEGRVRALVEAARVRVPGWRSAVR
jgi:hypothetical protein